MGKPVIWTGFLVQNLLVPYWTFAFHSFHMQYCYLGSQISKGDHITNPSISARSWSRAGTSSAATWTRTVSATIGRDRTWIRTVSYHYVSQKYVNQNVLLSEEASKSKTVAKKIHIFIIIKSIKSQLLRTNCLTLPVRWKSRYLSLQPLDISSLTRLSSSRLSSKSRTASSASRLSSNSINA